MKVFLSWSGETSQKVASEFRTWLPTVIQRVKPYISSEDINKGEQWSSSIAGELEGCSFGVIFLTPDNISAPWLNFEAGALGKTIGNARVCPLLFGLNISDVQGPLKQFQATQNTKSDILKLLNSINDADEDNKVDVKVLETTFDALWPTLENKIEGIEIASPIKIKKEKENTDTNDNTQILEEILSLCRQSNRKLNTPEDMLPPEYMKFINAELKEGMWFKNRDINHAVLKDLGRSFERLEDFAKFLTHQSGFELHAADLKERINELSGPLWHILRRA